MDWDTKCWYLKRNLVTGACQSDYVFNSLQGKVILSGTHSVGQILNYKGIRRKYQGRVTKHFHAALHIENAPKINEDDDQVVNKFIEKYISCLLPNPDYRVKCSCETS